MNIVFYVVLTMIAVYAVFHYKDLFDWWYKVILAVPVKIWNLIKKIFGR